MMCTGLQEHGHRRCPANERDSGKHVELIDRGLGDVCHETEAKMMRQKQSRWKRAERRENVSFSRQMQ
jgi:hypothetical protein